MAMAHPTLPPCTCHTTLQFHTCGCPDAGLDAHGHPIPTIRRCSLWYAPAHIKYMLHGLGWSHNPVLQLSPIPRVLPFPCYHHQQTCRIPIPPSQMSSYFESQKQKQIEKKLSEIAVHIRADPSERRVQVCEQDRTRAMRTARYTARNVESGWQETKDEDDAWLREEQEMNLYRLDSAPGARLHSGRTEPGNPLWPRYREPWQGYTNGAWMVNETGLFAARFSRGGYEFIRWLEGCATGNPWELSME